MRTVTAHTPNVFTLLRQAAIRLRRHGLSLLGAGIVVMIGRISTSFFLTEEVAAQLTVIGKLLLVLFQFTLWISFVSFALALLERDGRRDDILAEFPAVLWRTVTVSLRLLWHVWLLAAMLGTFTLVLSPKGFAPSVALLWAAAIFVAIVRGPRAALAPVIAFHERALSPAAAIAKSRHLTTKRWPTVAVLLAVIAGLTIILGRLFTLSGLPEAVFPLTLCGQALGLAALVELERSLERR